jgi:beta-xylosidase
MGKPEWAVQNFWAPEIHIIGHSYVAYYTARDSSGHLCIGVAYSEHPLGPYIDKGAPLLRNATEGVIDATIQKFSNGTIYLVYKVDGNAHGKPTEIYAIQLTNDGKSLSGPHHLLFRDSLAWEHGIVEAPWVIEQDGEFFVFYSSCGYANTCYSVGVAKSKNFLGPYEKHPTPILHTR